MRTGNLCGDYDDFKKELQQNEKILEQNDILMKSLMKSITQYHDKLNEIKEESNGPVLNQLILQKLKLLESSIVIKEEVSMEQRCKQIYDWMLIHQYDGLKEEDVDEISQCSDKFKNRLPEKQTDIPEELKFEGIEKCVYQSNFLYMIWVAVMKSIPPKWMLIPGWYNFVNLLGNDIYMTWLQFVKTPVPKELPISGRAFCINENGENLPMNWVNNIKEKDVPQEMLYPGCERQLNKDHRNIAILWLMKNQTPFPQWMYYEGIERQHDCDVMNVVKLWDKYIKTPYPYDYSKTYNQ